MKFMCLCWKSVKTKKSHKECSRVLLMHCVSIPYSPPAKHLYRGCLRHAVLFFRNNATSRSGTQDWKLRELWWDIPTYFVGTSCVFMMLNTMTFWIMYLIHQLSVMKANLSWKFAPVGLRTPMQINFNRGANINKINDMAGGTCENDWKR